MFLWEEGWPHLIRTFPRRTDFSLVSEVLFFSLWEKNLELEQNCWEFQREISFWPLLARFVTWLSWASVFFESCSSRRFLLNNPLKKKNFRTECIFSGRFFLRSPVGFSKKESRGEQVRVQQSVGSTTVHAALRYYHTTTTTSPPDRERRRRR